MNYSNYNSVPNDPDFEKILRRAYNTDSDAEKEATLKMMEKDAINKEIFEGILIIKKKKGFSSIEEHLNWVEQDKKKFRDFYNTYKAKSIEKRKQKIKLIAYSSAAAIAGFIISFGISQLTLPDDALDLYVSIDQYDSLKQEVITLSPLVEENKALLAKVSMHESELFSMKQTLEIKIERLKILENNPTAINEIALYKRLAERKGYEDKDGLFSLPDTVGVYAGGIGELNVVLQSPKNLKAFFLDEPLKFSWKTDIKGSARLNCYVAKSLDDAFKKEIGLENKTLTLDVANLSPGVYFWVIIKDGTISKRKYFVLLP